MILAQFFYWQGWSWKDDWTPSTHLTHWYQPWEQCVLADLVETSPIDLLQKCQKIHGKDRDNYLDYKCRVGGERFQYSCALDGPPPTPGYHTRPYLMKSLKNFDNPSKYYLRDFMMLLLRLKGNLLIFGDSQVQSLCRAMTCELARTRNSPDQPQERPSGALFNQTLVPIQCINHNNLLDIDTDLAFIRETILQTFQREFRYTFVMINVGTHYNDLSDEIHHHKNSRDHFKQHLLKLLPLLDSLSLQYPFLPSAAHQPMGETKTTESHPSLHISWLETPLQHYDTPNGYYNGTLTDCVPLRDSSLRSDWRNYDVYTSLAALNITTLSIVPLREIMIPLYREHHRGHGVDCTHYCYWPMLYQTVYKRMLDILHTHTSPSHRGSTAAVTAPLSSHSASND
jgi:hypothetical protein